METTRLPDAELQCVELAGKLREQLRPDTLLVGIHTGGAWVAKRVADLLDRPSRIGLLDISFYRDDFGQRGLHPQVKPTSLPLDVEGRPVILIDDVLFTGRTTRAAINELFDYGRPASIQLAVLADRGQREMPVRPDFCPWRPALEKHQELVLEQNADGRLRWRLADHGVVTGVPATQGIRLNASHNRRRECLANS